MRQSKALLLAGMLLLCLSLWGCGTQAAAETQPKAQAAETALVGEPEMDLSGLTLEQLREELPRLTALKTATLAKDSLTAQELAELRALRPDVDFAYRFTVNGVEVGTDTERLDLSSADNNALRAWFLWAAQMPALKSMELGSGAADDGRVPWDELAELRAARPDLKVYYSFTLWGQVFSLDDTEMNLTHIRMDDQGALVKAVAQCMPALRRLDMDSCGVDNVHMAAIRDALPDCEVIWRIWFGDTANGCVGYTVRTDVDRILASNPGIGGELTPENTEALQYCTKVKYLDLGHNSYMRSIEFVRSMPELEAVVLAMGNWYDASPLESCPNLRYAELQTTCISDLRPLSRLKNLTDLNLCYCFALHDISPLYELPQLKRLYLGSLTPVPAEQVERMREIAPNCEIDTTIVDPTQGNWRVAPGYNEYGMTEYTEAYAWLREVMRYDEAPASYAYPYNDPLY